MSGSGSTYFMIGENFAEQGGFWVKNGLKATASGIGISEELEVKSEK